MLRYDPSTALLIVDVQNDFADPSGSLAVSGGADIVPLVNAEIRAARAGGATVVLTQDWHPESTPHFVTDGGPWPVHCVGGSWGAELHPDLEPPPGAPIVRKGTNGEDGYSGFAMRDPRSGDEVPTELEGLLRERGIQRVTVCGLATDYCVKATVLDAVRLGFGTTLLASAVAAVDVAAGDGERALAEIEAAGVEMIPG